MKWQQRESEPKTLVYARVITFNNAKCRTCGTDIITGSEARLELALGSETTGLPCRETGIICLQCFGQLQRGEQIPDSLLR